MRRQRVPLGKAAWATRWVSSGIERAGSGRSDMGRWSKGSPVRWSGTSPSAPDLRITPWEGGRWNSPPVSTLCRGRKARLGAIEGAVLGGIPARADAGDSDRGVDLVGRGHSHLRFVEKVPHPVPHPISVVL